MMLKAVDQLNNQVSTDNLEALVKAWPHEEMEGLMEEHAKDKDALKAGGWDKAETYFIKLGEKPKFELRLKIWLFKINFDKTVGDIIDQ